MSSIDNFHQAQIYHIAPDATQTDADKLKGLLGRGKKKKKGIANSVLRNILKTLIRGLDKMCLQPQPFCYSAILNRSDSSRDTNNRQKTHSTDRRYISHSKTVLWDSETAWKDRHSICVSECNTETGCWVSQGSPAPNWDLCEVCLTEKCQNSTQRSVLPVGTSQGKFRNFSMTHSQLADGQYCFARTKGQEIHILFMSKLNS